MIIYDLIVLFATLFTAIKKPHHLRRFFARIPETFGKEVIWIHAVSVGEAKSVQPLFSLLRKAYPCAFILITTTTTTGSEEARRSLKEADAFAFLPVDLSWIVRRWAHKLRPKCFLMVESDIWPNLLAAIRTYGGKTVLVSGKMSEISAKRFALFHFFSKRLFDRIDLLCVQNEEHFQRFLPLTHAAKIQIGGNLKLDQDPVLVDAAFWKQELSIVSDAITIASTHAPEEYLLLDCIPLERVFVFLAPRHPERFDEVANILNQKKIPFFRWSRRTERKGGERVLLMDAMGKLPICYCLSRFAIVAGSFQSRVGGHNLLEPCLYGIPVFFGPYVFAQKELARLILSASAGMQVSFNTLPNAIENFLNDPEHAKRLHLAAICLTQSTRGSARKTFDILKSIFCL